MRVGVTLWQTTIMSAMLVLTSQPAQTRADEAPVVATDQPEREKRDPAAGPAETPN